MSAVTEKVRQVAILVATLDQSSADAVLEQMDAEQAALVRNAIMDLDDIDTEEQNDVIQAFLDNASGSESGDGVELDPSLQALLQSPEPQQAGLQTAESDSNSNLDSGETNDDTPFRFLHEAATDTLAAYLRKEHPQIAAIVISHLPPRRAAQVIAGLSPSIRGEVLARVGRRAETDPQIVREVESGLRHIITERMAEDSRLAAGVGAVRAILEAVDDLDRSEMLGAVAQVDGALAEQLGDSTATPFAVDRSDQPSQPPAEWMERLQLTPRETPRPSAAVPAEESPRDQSPNPVAPAKNVMEPSPTSQASAPVLEFEDLVTFDDSALSLIFEAAEPHVAFLALAGAPVPLVDRITKQLSAREARALRRRMENIGPLRLLDVELAQRQVARCAVQLCLEGRLALPTKRFSVAA